MGLAARAVMTVNLSHKILYLFPNCTSLVTLVSCFNIKKCAWKECQETTLICSMLPSTTRSKNQICTVLLHTASLIDLLTDKPADQDRSFHTLSRATFFNAGKTFFNSLFSIKMSVLQVWTSPFAIPKDGLLALHSITRLPCSSFNSLIYFILCVQYYLKCNLGDAFFYPIQW